MFFLFFNDWALSLRNGNSFYCNSLLLWIYYNWFRLCGGWGHLSKFHLRRAKLQLHLLVCVRDHILLLEFNKLWDSVKSGVWQYTCSLCPLNSTYLCQPLHICIFVFHVCGGSKLCFDEYFNRSLQPLPTVTFSRQQEQSHHFKSALYAWIMWLSVKCAFGIVLSWSLSGGWLCVSCLWAMNFSKKLHNPHFFVLILVSGSYTSPLNFLV